MEAFTFFDVETPNRSNGQICQIGVIRTDSQGREEYRCDYLINPQTRFDDINVSIHGIAPHHVKDAPTLPQVWEAELRDVFSGSVLVAHNARSTDLTVLSKDLLRYDYDPLEALYVCTLAMARNHLPTLAHHRLDDICGFYGVNLTRHHDAMADTDACTKIFWAMVRDFGMPSPQHFLYSGSLKNVPSKTDLAYHAKTLAHLYAVLAGVTMDRTLGAGEYEYIEQWWSDHKHLIVDEQFAKNIEHVLADKRIDADEMSWLLSYCAPYVNNYGASRETRIRNIVHGILEGIEADKQVSFCEAKSLFTYLRDISIQEDIPDFSALINELEKAIQDGTIDKSEEKRILDECESILNPLVQQQDEDNIDFSGKKVVLTGNFETMSRGEFKQYIERSGGIVVGGVSGKVDYLVVGGLGSTRWAHGNHGTKIRKAHELQQKGGLIKIIAESAISRN